MERRELGALELRRAEWRGVVGFGEAVFCGDLGGACFLICVASSLACKAEDAGSEAESAMVRSELRGA